MGATPKPANVTNAIKDGSSASDKTAEEDPSAVATTLRAKIQNAYVSSLLIFEARFPSFNFFLIFPYLRV